MGTTIEIGAWRELGLVVAVAAAGVGLASVVAFTPWHPGGAEHRHPAVVQVHAPAPVRPALLSGDFARVAVRSP